MALNNIQLICAAHCGMEIVNARCFPAVEAMELVAASKMKHLKPVPISSFKNNLLNSTIFHLQRISPFHQVTIDKVTGQDLDMSKK